MIMAMTENGQLLTVVECLVRRKMFGSEPLVKSGKHLMNRGLKSTNNKD